MMKKPSGYIPYRGPSMLDGAPIISIATLGTSNAKTGAVVQTWILREDIAPHEATKTGDDSSVCGNCRHRPVNAGTCYVTVFQAPLSVWKAYRRGAYPDATAPAHRGRARRGAHGETRGIRGSCCSTITSVASTHFPLGRVDRLYPSMATPRFRSGNRRIVHGFGRFARGCHARACAGNALFPRPSRR